MGRRVRWEWKLTEVDPHGDLQECEFEDAGRLKDFMAIHGELVRQAIEGTVDDRGWRMRLDLVRDECDGMGCLGDRSEAEVIGGILNDETDGGNPVPKHLKREFARLMTTMEGSK
jgi:hypothetical protein